MKVEVIHSLERNVWAAWMNDDLTLPWILATPCLCAIEVVRVENDVFASSHCQKKLRRSLLSPARKLAHEQLGAGMGTDSQKEWDSVLKRLLKTVVIDQFDDLTMRLAILRSLGPVIPYRAGLAFSDLSTEALMRLCQSMKIRD